MNITVRDNIKRNIAQKFPGVFTSNGGVPVTIETNDKTLNILGDGLPDGEWVFSGAENTSKVSAGYINDIFNIQNNTVALDFNAGDKKEQAVLAQQINIYFAANNANAKKIISDSTNYPHNKIILYLDDIQRVLTEDDKSTLSEDLEVSARFTFGVAYHASGIDTALNNQQFLYDDFIMPCLYIRPEDIETTSLVVFERMLETDYIANKYYIAFIFSYIKNVYNKEEYLNRIRYFDSAFAETNL